VRPRKAYVALASFFTATRWASVFLISSVLQDASEPRLRGAFYCTVQRCGAVLHLFAAHLIAAA